MANWAEFASSNSDYARSWKMCFSFLDDIGLHSPNPSTFYILETAVAATYVVPEGGVLRESDAWTANLVKQAGQHDSAAIGTLEHYYLRCVTASTDAGTRVPYAILLAALYALQNRDEEAVRRSCEAIDSGTNLPLPRMAEYYVLAWCIIVRCLLKLINHDGVAAASMAGAHGAVTYEASIQLQIFQEALQANIRTGSPQDIAFLGLCMKVNWILIRWIGWLLTNVPVHGRYIHPSSTLEGELMEVADEIETKTQKNWEIVPWVENMVAVL
jgi:hypothetical protein